MSPTQYLLVVSCPLISYILTSFPPSPIFHLPSNIFSSFFAFPFPSFSPFSLRLEFSNSSAWYSSWNCHHKAGRPTDSVGVLLLASVFSKIAAVASLPTNNYNFLTTTNKRSHASTPKTSVSSSFSCSLSCI